MTQTMVFSDGTEPPKWLDHTQTINGRKWIVGSGILPCDVIFIGEYPGRHEVNADRFFAGPSGEKLFEKIDSFGVNAQIAYFTSIIKFKPKGKRPTAGELRECRPILEEELRRSEASLIVPMGKEALAAVMGKGYPLGEFHGAVVDHPTLESTKVVPMYNPAYILHNPDAEAEYDADWRILGAVSRGEDVVTDQTEWVVYHKIAEVVAFREWLLQSGKPITLVIDAEWHGKNWQDKTGYIRTLQIGYAVGKAVVIELFDEHARCVFDDHKAFWTEIKVLLTHPLVGLVGHNVRSDGHWIATYDVDIRPRVVYDTMIAEHAINGAARFALASVTTKYTRMGRYDMALLDWKSKNKSECVYGFGKIPADILIPYSAKDVDAPRRVMEAQLSALAPYRKPRGIYPSLWEVDMHAQDILYEPERVGLRIDKDRLIRMINMYQEARSELAGRLTNMATTLGMPEFNPASHLQVRKLLFGKLNMTPIATTGGKQWATISSLPTAAQAEVNPTTNKETMAILADQEGAHPIVGLLRDYRKVDYVCNHWLCDPVTAAKYDDDASSRGGGLLAKMWPDGRLHAWFSQLKETARFGSSRPNVQNWMKRAEGELVRVLDKELQVVSKHFGEGVKLPSLRTIIIPTEGYVFLEADWTQAEMFVLAALSGDQAMWDALTMPGQDLHDLTAITAFGLRMEDPSGKVVTQDDLVLLARSDPDWKKDDSKFSKYRDTLMYIDQRGQKLTRKEFKSSIRVSAKNLNFGIPYGRGSQDIAIQVKAETGSNESIHKLREDLDVMMDTWKKSTYPKAWSYMEQCAESVTDPGYLANPWGRKRHFPRTSDREQIGKMGREAQNFPIQSTVADTCLIALWMMTKYRKEHDLHFRIVNQIHDSLLVETPEGEIEETKQMFYATMGNIDIPMPGGQPLRLDIDIDVMSRWAG